MTTKTTGVLLEPVGAALVAANHALELRTTASASEREAATREVEQALVALLCAACDAVASWDESERDPEYRDQGAIGGRVLRWRGQIDDLRVQAALAQMELRDSSHHAVAAVEQRASAVEELLVGAVHEIGSAIVAFRSSLRPKD